MPLPGPRPAFGLSASLALHALLLAWIAGQWSLQRPGPGATGPSLIRLQLLRPPPEAAIETIAPVPAAAPPLPRLEPLPPPQIAWVPAPVPQPPRQPATMEAPPEPTAEEWAFAGSYRLKNSKAYRWTWGRQVRSRMGTAVEGPDQGMVRLRVEIAPDGTLTRLETLWSTSPLAERLARQAIASMPRWPATPTGRPLVFERTIAFTPYADDSPPIYRDDCLPDPPAFRNPFVWDGRSGPGPSPATALGTPREPLDPRALEDCLKQLPQDSIDADSARDRRLLERWGSSADRPGR